MPKYSPFDRPITDLHPADLAILTSVSEGWYVDYKRDLIGAGAMAKAVSAFANTYGGWLFLGVRERSKDDPVAGEFPGLSNKDVDVAQQRLRQSAAEHVNPTLFFQTKVLRGPCVEIGLAEGASVVVVEIPQSQTATHIHRDGRIYMRVADSSEPKHETDRFLLDQLWRRAEPIRKMTREWIEQDPEFSEAEDEKPYLRLLLCVDPWRQPEATLDKPLSEIRAIMNGQEPNLPSSVPFDTVYTTAGGFIARQVRNNDPHNYTLTWRMRRDLRCEMVVPLPFYEPGSLDDLRFELDGYQHQERFMEILEKHGHRQPRVADLNLVVNALIGTVSQYGRLLRLAGSKRQFHVKARVLNAWRIVPFIDAEIILHEFDQHEVPMIMDSTVTVPDGYEPDSFVVIEEDDTGNREGMDAAVQAFSVFQLVAIAFGFSAVDRTDSPEDRTTRCAELLATGARAMKVQQNRSQRYLLSLSAARPE